MTTQSVLQLLERRSSVREFAATPVSREAVDTVLSGALRAPTSFNFQPYSIVVSRDPGTRAGLAAVAGDQPHVRRAPVLLVVCADLARVRRWCGLAEDADPAVDPDLLVACVTDAALAGMCASLVAESLGLGTVMIGGIRNDPGRVADLLALPSGVLATFAICLGYPAVQPPPRPRLAPALCVHHERYDERAAGEAAEYRDSGLRLPGGTPVSAQAAAAWREQLVRGARRALRMAPMTDVTR